MNYIFIKNIIFMERNECDITDANKYEDLANQVAQL